MSGRIGKDGSHMEKDATPSSQMNDVKKSPAVEGEACERVHILWERSRVGSWEWFQFSSRKVEKLIGQCLGPLVHHSHTNVRIALAEGLHNTKRQKRIL